MDEMRLEVGDIYISPVCFASGDRMAVQWEGQDYVKTCGELVTGDAEGEATFCIEREGHRGRVHEDLEGNTRSECGITVVHPTAKLQLEHLDLEEAVFQAVGAVASCWNNGIFDSTQAKEIGDQLMTRIRQAGPIYG